MRLPRSHPTRFVCFVVAFLAAFAVVPAAAAIDISVQTDRDADGMRVMLTHSAPVAVTVSETEGALIVRYADQVKLDSQPVDLSDEILAGYTLQNDRELIFRLGPGYRTHEHFELNNPSRLVLDLRGEPGSGAPTVAPAPRTRGERVIVIDPGHGGREKGAAGPTGLLEKDVTLDLAQRLKRELQTSSDWTVVLTRDEDRIVGLDERTAIANHNQADLFLSIHLNASPRRSARGAETYFLSAEATDNDARKVAAMESRLSGVEPQDGAPTGDSLELVLWDLAQNRFLAESSSLGEKVQSRLNDLTGTRNRGVRQAPFRVLMGATMPAILVEVGFITNRDEESKFKTDDYKENVVSALASAVRDYLQQLNRLQRPTPAVSVGGGSSP